MSYKPPFSINAKIINLLSLVDGVSISLGRGV
jgi:hypothetical protein